MRNSKECEGVVGSVRVHAPLLTVCVCAHAMFSSCLGGLGAGTGLSETCKHTQ